MSTLSQFATGGVRSIQTGFISTSSLSSGTGEEAKYIDVTVSAVTNVAKCLVTFNGTGLNSLFPSVAYYAGSTAQITFIPTIRVLNSTTIRIMISSSAANSVAGRWTLIEYF